MAMPDFQRWFDVHVYFSYLASDNTLSEHKQHRFESVSRLALYVHHYAPHEVLPEGHPLQTMTLNQLGNWARYVCPHVPSYTSAIPAAADRFFQKVDASLYGEHEIKEPAHPLKAADKARQFFLDEATSMHDSMVMIDYSDSDGLARYKDAADRITYATASIVGASVGKGRPWGMMPSGLRVFFPY